MGGATVGGAGASVFAAVGGGLVGGGKVGTGVLVAGSGVGKGVSVAVGGKLVGGKEVAVVVGIASGVDVAATVRGGGSTAVGVNAIVGSTPLPWGAAGLVGAGGVAVG